MVYLRYKISKPKLMLMKKSVFYLLLGSGWVLLAMFLISGYYYNKLTADESRSNFQPIAWDEHLLFFEGALQCTLTEEDLLVRKKKLKEEIFAHVSDKKELSNGFLYYFDYEASLFSDILEFTEKEIACCPFFKFDISVLPFEKGVAVQISGSEEVKEILYDFETNEF